MLLILSKFRSSHQRYYMKKKFLEILQNWQESNTCARVSFLIKLQAWNFTKFLGKQHLCQSLFFIKVAGLKFHKNFPENICASLFFNKVAGLRPATLLKKRLWHRCFPGNFVKFLRTTFCIENLWWLLLQI